MFANLIRRLSQGGPAPLPDPDARLAIAALLVRVAKADGHYAVAEVARIDRILARRFALDAVAAARLRADAEAVEHEAPDTVRFTRAIKDAVSFDDRAAVVQALWEVALSDGGREAHEDQLLRIIAPLLGLSDPESAQARQRALAALG
jgi:uncharacterized tellurite resistance protein B-like protein